MSLQEERVFAREIALEAGTLIMSYLDRDKQVEVKTTAMNLVTVADKESEKLLVNALTDRFPKDSILAEEGSEVKGSSGRTWVLDPLDGTNNFAHGFPLFAVSVALVDHNDKPLVGVVHNPFFDETFEAERGAGAFLNSKTISTSAVSKLDGALLGTGFPYNRRKIMSKLLQRLSDFLNIVHGIRRSGSAALDICYVGCGRLDGYYEEALNAWDVAAAVLVVEEAGGHTARFDGSPMDIYFPELVASNSHLAGQIVDTLRNTT